MKLVASSGSISGSGAKPRLQASRSRVLLRRARLLCWLLMLGASPIELHAGMVVDFRQAANNDTGFGLGNTHWINAAIGDGNSRYYEDMSVMQRVLFAGVPTTAGNHHSLLFRHQFTKGGLHSYDFLTSFAQAQADNAAALGVTILVNPCGVDIGPPTSLATNCLGLDGGVNVVDVAVPTDSFISKDGLMSDKITAYEAGHGARTIRIAGDAPISNASLSVCHDVANGGDTSDSFALYALTWDSTSTNILIEMAGHLARSGDGTGDSWGARLGSGFISGGSFHFKLDTLAGALSDSNCPPGVNQKEVTSLGSQDNQIRSATTPPPAPPCNISGASSVCPGSTNTYQGASFGPSLTYAWSIAGSGTFLGANTSSNVTVVAGNGAAYTLGLTLTVISGPLSNSSTCSFPVTVNPLPPCAVNGTLTVCPSSTNTYVGPPGMASYSWSISGGGSILGSPGAQAIDVADSSDCNTNFTLSLTVVDTNGCFNTCQQTVLVQDTTPPTITCPGPINAAENPRFSGGAIINYPSAVATDNCTANPAIFNTPPPGSLFPVGTNVVICTAVDNCSNSNSCTFTIHVIPYEIVVTSTNDSGPGSLRQALLDANDSPDENLVVFNLPGFGPYTIGLLSPLPEITSPIIIDGWSQAGSNNPPVIQLDGSAGGQPTDGLLITVGNSTVRGLVFSGFGTAIRLQDAGGNVVQGNFIGTDSTGTNATGNSGDGIYISSPGNLITGNVISGNGSNGVEIASVNASNNIVQGNWIGVGLGGGVPLGNGGNGVFFTDQAANNLVGGTNSGSGNTISYNGKSGITLDATAGSDNGLLGNVILSNAQLGIDLGGDGVTPNDPNDVDSGPNGYQNFPVLSDVQSIEGTTTVFGQLPSVPNTRFRIEFYLNDNNDPSGYGQGQTFIGSMYVTTAASGSASFSIAFPLLTTFTQFITATATDPQNNTSEFSKASPVRTPPILGAGPVSTNVAVGMTATFCTTATGTPPILYQWRLNGFNIPGATDACYTVPAAQIAQGGTYTVLVGNGLGAAATLPATMTLAVSNFPAGTNFAGRVALSGTSGLITADNRNGSFEPGEPLHAGQPGGKAVWYSWIAPVTGVVTMQTSGSTFDTLLAVYTGNSLSNLVVVDSDEGHGGFYTSKLNFNAFQGTQYQIAIDGFGGDSGTFILSWQEQNTSHLLPVFLNQPQNQTVAPGGTAIFNSTGGRVCGNGQTNCFDPNPQLSYQWYFFGNPIPGATTNVLVVTNVQPAQVGTYSLLIWTPYQTNQSDNAFLQINLTGSDVENALATDKLLDAQQALVIGNSAPQLTTRVTDGSGPTPKDASIVRGYTGTQVFNTTGSATSPGEVICGVIGGASDWLSFVAEAPGVLYLNTDGSSYDTVMAVFRRSPTNSSVLQLLACDNNSGSNGLTSALSIPVVAGQTNYIDVDGVNGVSGILQLNYSLVTSAIIKAAGASAEGVHLQLLGRTNLHFTIQGSTDFANWTSLITTTSQTAVFDYIDTGATNLTRRYYRAVLLP